MPFKSKAQERLFYAAAEGKVPDISPKVAMSYIEDSKGKRKLKAKRKSRRAD